MIRWLSSLVLPVFLVSASLPSMAGTKLMVFGDSLSSAYGIDPAKGWVALLETRLKQRDPTAMVVNASISGETSHGGLARIEADLRQHRPTHVLLQLGPNDGLRGLPLNETRNNLEKLVLAIRRANAQPILVGLQLPPNYGLEYAREFRDLYPELAKRLKLPLIPFLLEGFAEKRDLFLPDGLHPTAAAQVLVLDNVWPVVERTIKVKP